jgi:DNA-binding CsgD family transcriptional regulator
LAITWGEKSLVCDRPSIQLGCKVLANASWLRVQRTLRLSQRELQIVQCLFEDEKQDAIAWRLGISSSTVNTYIQRLYTKLRVNSRSQLIVRVIAEYLFVVSAGEHVKDEDPI